MQFKKKKKNSPPSLSLSAATLSPFLPDFRRYRRPSFFFRSPSPPPHSLLPLPLPSLSLSRRLLFPEVHAQNHAKTLALSLTHALPLSHSESRFPSPGSRSHALGLSLSRSTLALSLSLRISFSAAINCSPDRQSPDQYSLSDYLKPE